MSISEDHNALYKLKVFWKALSDKGFAYDQELNDEYESPHRCSLWMRYHGMGCAQIIGCDPSKKYPLRYFYGVLGGPNGYDANDNESNFKNIGNEGTIYYTPNEILELVERNMIYDGISYPK